MEVLRIVITVESELLGTRSVVMHPPLSASGSARMHQRGLPLILAVQ